MAEHNQHQVLDLQAQRQHQLRQASEHQVLQVVLAEAALEAHLAQHQHQVLAGSVHQRQ